MNNPFTNRKFSRPAFSISQARRERTGAQVARKVHFLCRRIESAEKQIAFLDAQFAREVAALLPNS